MHGKEKTFTFYLTGRKDNDTAVENYVRTHGYNDLKCVFFKLEYTPPYKDFRAIADFMAITQYHPFRDPSFKKAAAVIDLSEWIGHENEENLEIFLKFLHDYDWSFYRYEYVFTVGDADKSKIKAIYAVVDEYLCKGHIYEDKTLTDEKSMSVYLYENYPVNRALAERLSYIFVANKINGYAQIHTVMEDFIERADLKRKTVLTERQAGILLGKWETCKLQTLFEKDVMEWKKEYTDEMIKEVVA